MADLEPSAREILSRARPAFEPDAEQLARLRARLDLPDPPTPPPDHESDPGATPAPAANGAGWKIVIALVLAVGVGAGAVVASRSPDGDRRPDARTPAVARVETENPAERESQAGLVQPVVDAAPEPSTDTSSPSESPELPATETPGPAVSAAPLAPPRSGHRPSPGSSPTPAPTPATQLEGEASDSLEAELALIAAARLALRDGKHQAAIARAETYLEQFPRGSFVEEANVLKLVATCGHEPDEKSRSLARAYLANEEARFAGRVRRACLLVDD